MLQIDYVNAPAGAGKTYAGGRLMKTCVARGEKVILVQPITRLIGETVETTFVRQGIDPTIVTEISLSLLLHRQLVRFQAASALRDHGETDATLDFFWEIRHHGCMT